MTDKRPTLSLKPKAKPDAARRADGRKSGAAPQYRGSSSAARQDGPAQGGPRQGAPRQAGPREASPRGVEPRQAAPRQAGPREASPRGAEPRNAEPRWSMPRQAEPRWSEPGNANPRGAAPRQAEPRWSAPRQAEPRLRASHEFKVVPQYDFRPDLKVDSLALALLGAASAVARVRAGTALPQALSSVFASYQVTPQARGAIQDIAYRTMRQLGRAEVLLGMMISKAPDNAILDALLCAALVLLDPPDGTPAAYEAFTVVDQAVSAAAAHPDFAHAKAMVNAVLRRFLRQREALVVEALREPLARWNYPQWWIDTTRAAYPQQWEAILTAGNMHPPLTLRVNCRAVSVEAYLATLAEAGMAAEQVGPSAVRLAQAVNVSQIPGFADGLVSVQDAGAQLAAPLLDLQDGMRVLDACAAPGGKSGHILERADVELTSVDADPARLARVEENLERLGLSAELVAAQAQHSDWWDGRQFDRILADVPCTASGIVRRHPDIRWLRRKSDTTQLATLSSDILDNLWQMLLPNGKLLFVTCSLWPQESEAQAAAFAVRHDAIRLDAPGQLLPTGVSGQDHDGLFYALFQKKAA